MPASTDTYISRFKPESHYFTDPAAVTQGSNQKFGPESTDVFHLTSRFTITAAKAFAICKGVVLLQPQTGNANAVNLVLRPYTQPINGLNIKYFIYRGLNKADFFSGENVIAAGPSTSDFINKINQGFANFYQGQIIPPFLAKYLGFNTAQADSLMLDDFFFKETAYDNNNEEEEATAFELPMIFKGASLGNFIAGEGGIDVVLSYGDYKFPQPNSEFVFNLAYARKNYATIDLTAITNEFERKVKKEQIFQFLDVAAYFGFHVLNGTVEIDNNGTKIKKKGDSIYTDVVSKFFTKNILYLYIQSDRTRSYNFYGNYFIEQNEPESLKMGIVGTALTETVYGTDGWPVILQSGAQAHSDVNNHLYLQLATDNNVNMMLYGQVAEIVNDQHNNFCDAANLKHPLDTEGNEVPLTKIIQLDNPATGPSGSKENIGSFNILIYQGKIYEFIAGQELDENSVLQDVYAAPNFFDDVFDQLNATSVFASSTESDYSVTTSQRIKLVNHYFNQTQYGISAVQTTIVNDVIDTDNASDTTLKRVTYVTEAVDNLNDSVAVGGKLTNDTKATASMQKGISNNKTYQLPEPFYYERTLFTDGTDVIVGLQLKSNNNEIPNKIILGFSHIENEMIIDLVDQNALINPRLFLVDLFDDDNELISAENIIYQKYKVGLVSETVDGELQLLLPTTQIIAYSIDRKFHYTELYSRYVKEYMNIELALDLDIAL